MGALTAHGQILLAPWRRSPGARPSWSRLLTVLLGAAPTLAACWLLPAQAGNVALGTAVLGLQFVWLTLFSHLLRQNHPAAARLVPGHVRRLRESLTASYLLLAALSGLLLGAITGPALAWMLVMALVMLLTATLTRWPLLWAGVGLVPALVPLLRRTPAWAPLREGLMALYAQRPALLLMLALLVLPWLLNQHLQSGGGAHAGSYTRRERLRLAMLQASMGGSAVRYQGRIGLGLARLFSGPYRAWMRHLLARARPTAASVMARAELAAGAGTHWTAQAATAVLFLLVLAGVVALAWYGFGIDAWALRDKAAFGFSLGLMSAAISPALSLRTALWSARREQALLMLVPGMPRGAALNRLLARRLMRNFLCAWGGATALLIVLTQGTGGFYAALGYALACLPAGLMLWPDWSRMPQPGVGQMMQPVLALLAFGALLAALMFTLRPSPWWVLAGVLLPCLLAGAWRWRQLGRQRQAFPVGRWADAA